MNRRAEILHELVRFDKPTEPLVRELNAFGWDWSGPPLLVLTKGHLTRIIDRFLSGDIDAAQLQEWAENLEVREDVDFDVADRDLINEIFFRLATPLINEPLTPNSVRKLRDQLTATSANHFPQPPLRAAD